MMHFVEALVSAISLGSITRCWAIALSWCTALIAPLNFAQGEIGTFTIFIAFS